MSSYMYWILLVWFLRYGDVYACSIPQGWGIKQDIQNYLDNFLKFIQILLISHYSHRDPH